MTTGVVNHQYLRITNWIEDFAGGFIQSASLSDRAFDSALVPYACGVHTDSVMTLEWPAPSGDDLWVHFRVLYLTPRNTFVPSGTQDIGPWLEFFSSNNEGLGDSIFEMQTQEGRASDQNGGANRATLTLGSDATGGVDTTAFVKIFDYDEATALPRDMDFHFSYDSGTNTYSVDVYMSGGEFATFSVAATNTPGLGMPTSFTVVCDDLLTDGTTKEIYLSEVVVSEQDTRGLRLAMLNPTSAGNYNDWQGDFNELGDLLAITMASSQTADELQSSTFTTYGGPASSAGVQLALSAHAARGVDLTTPQELQQFLRIGATDYASVDGNHTLITSPQQRITLWPTNPVDGSAWSTADVSGIEGGLISRS